MPEIIIVREDVKRFIYGKLDRLNVKKFLVNEKIFQELSSQEKLTGNNHCLF